MPTTSSMIAIQQSYIAYYGRPADYAGQLYWAGVLDQDNGSLDKVIQAFGNSVESNKLYGGSATAQRIDKIYEQLFNRLPDEAGKNWWATEIEAGRVTLQSAALQILNGATNDDLLMIRRKTDAAEQFTEALRTKNMSHAYTEADIDAARGFLSSITLQMTDAQLSAHLDATLLDVYNAIWASFQVDTVRGGFNTLGNSVGLESWKGGLVFGDSGYLKAAAEMDVYVTTLDASLALNQTGRIGHAQFSETLQGLVKADDDSLFLWGDLDKRPNVAESNLQFLWTVDENLHPVAEARIGTVEGSAPKINKVLPLSDGKILVVGQQNNFGDGWDAFAIVFNRDLTVHAQSRFDSPARVGSSESFVNALELASGELVLVGAGGELFKVSQSLQRTDDDRDFSATALYHLNDDFLLLFENNVFHVVNANFDRIASFLGNSLVTGLVEKSPGEFVAYDSPGKFFNLSIHVDKASGKMDVVSDAGKQLVQRNGAGAVMHKYESVGDSIMAIQGKNIFVFNPDMPANPNFALDYRLIEKPVDFLMRDYNPNALLRPDWESGELQIVTVGVRPDFGAEQSIIKNIGVSFI